VRVGDAADSRGVVCVVGSQVYLGVAVQLLVEDHVGLFAGARADPPQPDLVVVSGRRHEPVLGHVDAEHRVAAVPQDLRRG